MRMKKIPRDTPTFHYCNVNPLLRTVGDCSTRSLSLFLDISWSDALNLQYEAALAIAGGLNDFDTIEYILKNIGYPRQKQPKKQDGTKYTAGEFAAQSDRDTMILCVVANHFLVIKEQKVWDIWNSTNKCVGRYWIRKV